MFSIVELVGWFVFRLDCTSCEGMWASVATHWDGKWTQVVCQMVQSLNRPITQPLWELYYLNIGLTEGIGALIRILSFKY